MHFQLKKLAFGILLFLISITQVFSQESCGSIPPPHAEMFLGDQMADVAFEDVFDPDNITYVALKVHLLRRKDGSSRTTVSAIQKELDATNEVYKGANMQFYIDGDINFIDVDSLYDFNFNDEDIIINNFEQANTINVCFANSIYKGSGYVGGYAYYPGYKDWAFVSHGNLSPLTYTLAHELGHFFHLYHTHGRSNSVLTDELVDGSNCQYAGDKVCDTPADPYLYNILGGDCVYRGTKKDANGDLFKPDTRNIMSYALQCTEHFSQGQFTRALGTLKNSRHYLKQHKVPIEKPEGRIEAEENFEPLANVGSNGDVSEFDAFITDDNQGRAVALFDSGDKLKIKFSLEQDGKYEIKVRLRSGQDGKPTRYWPDGYVFTIDETPITLIGDETSVSPFYQSFGGAHWGTMEGIKNNLLKGDHYLTIETTLDWAAVDYMEVIRMGDIPKNDPPTAIALSNTELAENQPLGTKVGDLSTTDPNQDDEHTYKLVDGTGSDDNNDFKIIGAALHSNKVFDFESKKEYSIRIETDDGAGGTFQHSFSISISDLEENEFPTDILLSNKEISENNFEGALIGEFSTIDPDENDEHTYTMVLGEGDDDNEAFLIEGNQLKAFLVFDYEDRNEYHFRVKTTDKLGGAFEKSFTIKIRDIFENSIPTDIQLSENKIAENQPENTKVGEFSVIDANADDEHSIVFVEGKGDGDNGAFSISGNILLAKSSFDFEEKNEYNIRVKATDKYGGEFEKSFFIKVTDMFENSIPTDILLSKNEIRENEPEQTVIGEFTATDENKDDDHNFELISGEGDLDNDLFEISGDQLISKTSFDYENRNEYSIRVKTTDKYEGEFEKSFTIKIIDIPDNIYPSDISLSNTEVFENEKSNVLIGLLSTEDEDVSDTHTYSLIAGEGDADNDKFSISNDSLKAAQSFDFETQQLLSIRVKTEDGNGGFFEKVFAIRVKDIFENISPEDIMLSKNEIVEEGETGSLIGSLTAKDGNPEDIHTFSFVGGEGSEDNEKFTISGDSLIVNQPIDFEEQSKLSIRLRVEDKSGATFEKIIQIVVIDIVEKYTLSGKVLTQTGEEISIGTMVLLNTETSEVMAEFKLDNSFEFQFTELLPGKFILKFLPEIKANPLSVPTYSGNALIMAEAEILEISAAHINNYILSVLEKENGETGEESIAGTVVDVDKNTGGRTTEAAVIKGVPIYLLADGSGKILDKTFSDENGEFNFSELAAGDYLIKADYQLAKVAQNQNKVTVQANADTVVVSLNIGATETWVEFQQITGKESFQVFAGVEIYPNPFQSEFSLQMENEYVGALEIRVLDLSGKVLITRQIQKQQTVISPGIKLDQFPSGIYLLNISGNQHSANYRIIKR
ncbi:cadherin domain-containing protein [Flexithrix dorotheae]|uniref:cadherin domain-containing protein n=1 Tax=Flexithrix dorotheae TaxID=70993 RepID=UPI000376A4F9|nr:cadherin domain-containing protein [Flexithrix dorotheae]